MPIPPGYIRCDDCGEFNGTTAAKHLTWHELDPKRDPEDPVSVSCLCKGILCRICGKKRLHRPTSTSYDKATNTIGHWSWTTGMLGCRTCQRRPRSC